MPRNGDIRVSFFEAMKRSPKYGVTVSTSDFVAELAKRNWEFSHKQANEWIAQNVMTFRDQSPEEGETDYGSVSITTGIIDMGFPSPAADFVESRIDLNNLMIHHPSDTMRIETPRGFVLVDRSLTPLPGKKVVWQVDGYPMVGKYFKGGIVTEDGETIDGGSLEGVVMLGVVTFEVLEVYEAEWLPIENS